MAETSKNKIYYNDNEDSIADVLEDMKKLAESADNAIEKAKYNDTELKNKDTAQDKLIEQLQAENTKLKKEINSMQIPGEATGNPIHLTDSSDLECEIVVKGNAEQETVTDNLFNNTWEQGLIMSETGENIDSDVMIRSNYTRIFPNHLYNISRNKYSSYMSYRFYDKDKKFLGTQLTEGMMTYSTSDGRMNVNESSMTFTIVNTNVAYMRVTDASNDLSTIYTLTTEAINPDYPSPIETVGQNGSVEISVDNGLETTDTNYQSYTKVLPIQKEMLEGDYIDDKEYHRWGKVVFDENSDIKCNHNSGTFQFRFLKKIENTDNWSGAICNLLKSWKGLWGENGCFISYDGRFYLLCKENEFGFNTNMTTDEAILHLREILTQTNLVVYYTYSSDGKPKTITLELTEEQKAVLNSFYTYKNVTNISMIGIGTLKVNYKKDLETIIKNLATATVALGGNINV